LFLTIAPVLDKEERNVSSLEAAVVVELFDRFPAQVKAREV
jgi:hypothetical protein